ncbi:MAG TPA: hypothetical protein VJJ24_02350 [Candidatus Paceibacterota bacterium]
MLLIIGIILITIGATLVAYWKFSVPQSQSVNYITLQDIEKDPASYDGMKVTLIGMYAFGFEINIIDDKIWLNLSNKTVFSPSPNVFNGLLTNVQNVRVVGTLHTSDPNGYGHNNAYPYQIDAESVTLLLEEKTDVSKQMQNDEDKAIQIAEQELLKHYPNKMRDGYKLELTDVSPIRGQPTRWFVKYDIPTAEDMGVEIIVDISTGGVVSFKDAWS